MGAVRAPWDQIVDEVGLAQVEATELHALNEHVDRVIDEKSKPNRLKIGAERHELDAMLALQEAWPDRWREQK